MIVRLVVFDLDGTLIDSRRDLADSANEMLSGYGASPLPEEAVGRMVGSGAAQLVARALSASHLEVPLDEALARFLAAYDERLTIHTRPYPGVPELLDVLSARRLTLALLTNKPLDASARILDRLGLAAYLPLRVGGDGPWPRKPAPDGLRFLMNEAAAVETETMLVGDSAVDVETAHRAGVRACLARYGFGSADLAPGTLVGDEVVVDHPREIAEVLP